MPVNLTYWGDIQGRVSAIKYICHHAGQEVVHHSPDRKNWPVQKMELEKSNPLINLPFIEHEYEPGKKYNLSQTYLIIKTLAEKFGYVGNTILDRIRVAEAEEQIRDIEFTAFMMVMFEPKGPKSEYALKDGIPSKIKPIENMLAHHGKKFLCADNLTYNDFMFFHLTESLLKMRPSILDSFPKVLAWRTTMMEDSKIREIREQENAKPFTVQYKKMFDDMPEEMKAGFVAMIGQDHYDRLMAALPTVHWGVEGSTDKIYD